MINFYKISILSLLFSISHISCNKSDKSNKEELNSKKETLYKDSTIKAWNIMMKNDDEKFENMNLAVKQIESNPESNSEAVNSLFEEIKKVKQSRFKINELNLQKMETYDSLTTILIDRIDSLAEKTEGMHKYAMFVDIMQKVRELDSNIILDRAHYDKIAKLYNQLKPKASKEVFITFEEL